jgi:hypothetical protein
MCLRPKTSLSFYPELVAQRALCFEINVVRVPHLRSVTKEGCVYSKIFNAIFQQILVNGLLPHHQRYQHPQTAHIVSHAPDINTPNREHKHNTSPSPSSSLFPPHLTPSSSPW